MVLGQIAVSNGTTKTTHVCSLLDPIDITGALATADTARYLVADEQAGYLLVIKGNRSSLHAAAVDAGRELIGTEAGHVIECENCRTADYSMSPLLSGNSSSLPRKRSVVVGLLDHRHSATNRRIGL